MISRRTVTGVLAAAALALTAGPTVAQEKTIKVAVLKLVGNAHALHYQELAPAGYKFDIVYVNTPADAKNAVATGSADFALGGVFAAILGNAAGEPVVIVANLTGGSMAVIAKGGSTMKSLADLKGKKVGIQPGSTQELVIAERLKQEKMSLSDIQPIRLGLGEMYAALARGDLDAYVGTEPGSSMSLLDGTGQLVEYPYGTPTGDLVTAMMANEASIKKDPKMALDFVRTHARATEFLKKNHDAWEKDGVTTFGLKPEFFRAAIKNINTEWKMDAAFLKRVDAFGKLMMENKMIRKMPTEDFVVTKFVEEVEKTGL